MVPVEDKSPPHNLKLELNLNQDDNANKNENVAASSSLSPSAKILNFERQQNFNQANIGTTSGSPPKLKTETAQRPKTLIKPIQQQQQQQHEMDIYLTEHTGKAIEGGGSSSGGSILATSSIGGSSDDGKKVKMTKIGNTKTVALKR